LTGVTIPSNQRPGLNVNLRDGFAQQSSEYIPSDAFANHMPSKGIPQKVRLKSRASDPNTVYGIANIP
jgi:hypothetical protein